MKILYLLVALVPGQPVISEHETMQGCVTAGQMAVRRAPRIAPWIACIIEYGA